MRPVYDLATLPTQRRDDELVFGVADDPDRQAQPEIAFRPDKEGNMAVYGTSGSGKSVFLRTIAVAAGYTVRGGPVPGLRSRLRQPRPVDARVPAARRLDRARR